MAEIKQTLGFDASSAIDTLGKLDANMRAFKTAVSSTTKAMGTFNTVGNKTNTVLKQMVSSTKAIKQLEKLSKIKPASVAAQATAAIPSTAGMDEYIAKFQEMYKQTGKLTTSQKRNHSSMISSAAEFASKNGISMKTIEKQARNLDKVYSGKANTMANHLNKMGNASKNLASKWTVSWQTMARVVATQAIVRALNSIRVALKAVVGDAIDFQRAIAEIGTIDPRSTLGGLGSIEDTVRSVSDAFNVDLADTAEAAYQSVSNQVVQSQADLESFLGSAAKFAKITKTDLSTSVNLLSGTLNAFGKETSEVEDVAAKFFKTIELGRTRAEELAQGMGTISPIADKLGISMEELNAGIATLTIGGIKTDKAVTQLRGTMQGFLKPTTAMIDALRELGFATGEQILEAYDLQDAVLAVTDTTDGNAASIAKLFPRIRGLTGVMALADDRTGHFKKTLEEQQTALEGTYDRAYELVVTTDAEKVTKFFREVKNWFVTEIGQRFLSGLTLVLGLNVEGRKTAIEEIKDANEEILKEENKLADKRTQIQLDQLLKQQRLTGQNAAEARKGFFEASAAAEEANTAIVASTEWALESMMRPVDAAVEAIKKAAAEGRELMGDFAQAADDAVSRVQETVFQRGIGQIEDPHEKVRLLRQKAAETAMKAQQAATSATTREELNLSEALQKSSESYNNQAFSISKSIDKKYVNGKATRDLTAREKELQKQQANQLTQDVIRSVSEYAKATAEGEKAIEASQKSLAETSREIVIYQAHLDTLGKTLGDLHKQAADTSLTPGEQDAAKKLAAETGAELTKVYEEGIKRFAESPDKLVRGLFDELQKIDMDVEIQTILAVPENMEKTYNLIKNAFEQMFEADPINVAVRLFAEGEGRGVETAAQLDTERRAFNAVREKAIKKSGEATKAQNAFNASQRSSIELLKLVGKITKERSSRIPISIMGMPSTTEGKEFVEPLSQSEMKFNDILKRMKELAKEGPKTVNSVAAIANELDLLPAKFQKGLNVEKVKALRAAFAEMLITARAFESQADNTESAMSEKFDPITPGILAEQTQARIDAANAQIRLNNETKIGIQLAKQAALDAQATTVPPIAEETDKATQSVLQLQNTQMGVTTEAQNSAAGVQAIDSNLQSANSSATGLLVTMGRISSIQSKTVTNPFVGQAHGGRVGYFANGGRGTDTIPAMLSAGETVTNARSSRRFFSQLQAINAGQKPIYRNDGGDTFNTNVGDINVSGSDSPQQTAREVMRAIRREERRGSSR